MTDCAAAYLSSAELKPGEILARRQTVIASVVWTRASRETYEALWKRAGPARNAMIAIQLIAFDRRRKRRVRRLARRVVKQHYETLDSDSSPLSLDRRRIKKRLRPDAEVMLMMARRPVSPRAVSSPCATSAGYGTQKNWMSVSRNCSITKGAPAFTPQSPTSESFKRILQRGERRMTENTDVGGATSSARARLDRCPGGFLIAWKRTSTGVTRRSQLKAITRIIEAALRPATPLSILRIRARR